MEKTSTPSPTPLRIVMMGATGAVGGEVVKSLLQLPQLEQLTLLGRRSLNHISDTRVRQYQIDIIDPQSYQEYLCGHHIAICTLGVGQPSKVSKEDFLKIDQQAVLDFAEAGKQAGVRHFELLSSVGTAAQSASFYLRSKGELNDALVALLFDRLSFFKPSMILTPTNRYGLSQAIVLKVWPWLTPLLVSGWRKYRGIQVEVLGQAIAWNILRKQVGLENLFWDDFHSIINTDIERY